MPDELLCERIRAVGLQLLLGQHDRPDVMQDLGRDVDRQQNTAQADVIHSPSISYLQPAPERIGEDEAEGTTEKPTAEATGIDMTLT